jgi:hypothetical protein
MSNSSMRWMSEVRSNTVTSCSVDFPGTVLAQKGRAADTTRRLGSGWTDSAEKSRVSAPRKQASREGQQLSVYFYPSWSLENDRTMPNAILRAQSGNLLSYHITLHYKDGKCGSDLAFTRHLFSVDVEGTKFPFLNSRQTWAQQNQYIFHN